MKLYKIRDWAALFENNRSRTVKDLAWVPIPNRHDGENYSLIMAQKNGAEIFAAWVLLLQVASRCHPRGSLLRDNQKPHTTASLAMKTRAPEKWFSAALEFLENETDWLEIDINCQPPVIVPPPPCQPPDEEGNGKKGMELNGKEQNGTPSPAAPVIDAEKIYEAYPLKVGKPAALKAISKAMVKVEPSELLALTQAYATRRNGDLSFTPHPSTWFNQERYNDDPSTWERVEPKPTNGHQPGKSLALRLIEEI